MVRRHSRRFGSGRKALSEVRELLGGPPRGLVVVGTPSRRSGRPSWRSGSGRLALPEVREWLGDPPGGPEVVGRPSRKFSSGR